MYRTQTLTALLSCILVTATFAEEKIEVKEIKGIDREGIAIEKVVKKVPEPVVITSKEKLAEVFTVKRTQEAIQKEVNFKKHQLLVFRWRGSGQDKLASKALTNDPKYQVAFQYTQGLSEDLQSHLHVFVLPKDAKWKMTTKGE
jgi:hypothetical protein